MISHCDFDSKSLLTLTQLPRFLQSQVFPIFNIYTKVILAKPSSPFDRHVAMGAVQEGLERASCPPRATAPLLAATSGVKQVQQAQAMDLAGAPQGTGRGPQGPGSSCWQKKLLFHRPPPLGATHTVLMTGAL